MTHAHRSRARLIVAVLASLLLASVASSALPSPARAAEPNGFGELTRFGETGNLGESGKLAELNTRAIGVDPTDNSVYLLDETKAPTETKRFLRLQKFTAAPGTHTYTVSASAQFTETSPSLRKLEPEAEGIAVDPAEGRVYLLTVDAREKGLGVDEGVTGEKKDEPLAVASTLYAFATKEAGSKLVGAGKEGEHNEVLTGPAELGAQSNVGGKALLEPRGITIDRAKHEVIVLAHIDENGAKEDAVSSAGDHYVLQRIEASGKPGARYVDSTDFFKQGFKPHSPIVVTTKNGKGEEEQHVDVGHVVEGVETVSEAPYDFTSTAPPHKLIGEPEGGIVTGVFGSSAGTGGRLAAGPEGALYGLGSVHNEAAGALSFAGVIAYSGADGSELGWTGGQQENASAACQLEIPGLLPSLPSSISTPLAVGSGGDVFVLAPEFLLREEEVPTVIENPETGELEEGPPEFVPLSGPFFPAVVELGPGGAGCQLASATAPVARVNGIEVKGEEPVEPGSEVTFSSKVKQADALSVEWDFGDGAKQTVSGDEYQTTTVKHKYETKGKYTVTEKIRFDDLAGAETPQPVWEGGQLATPTVTKTQTIDINTPVPSAKLTGPSSLTVGQLGTFDGSTSTDPNHSAITKYSWNFGDGASEVTTTPSRTHAYAAAGAYDVTLTVTDALGLTSAPATLAVHVEAPGGGGTGGGGGGGGGGNGGGGGSGTGGASGGGGAAGGGGSSPGGGGGGVLAYEVSVASTSLTATPSGSVVLKVSCGGPSSCAGTVTLRTVSAVSAARHKKSILTLASGSFTAAGASVKAVTLHLSAKARALLARVHVLRAQATIVARDSQGAVHTTPIVVTLRPAKKRR